MGPKGVGALYSVQRREPGTRLEAQIDGGGQEEGVRSGTLNVAGIVGFRPRTNCAYRSCPAKGHGYIDAPSAACSIGSEQELPEREPSMVPPLGMLLSAPPAWESQRSLSVRSRRSPDDEHARRRGL